MNKSKEILEKETIEFFFPFVNTMFPEKKGGETMSLNVLEQITATEKQCKANLEAAQAAARKLLADTDKQGKASVEQAKEHAESEVAKMMQRADESAAKIVAEIAQETKQEQAAIRSGAERHLEAAASFIVGRIVKAQCLS